MTERRGEPGQIGGVPLQWDESLAKGIYANTFYILVTQYEVTLDVAMRTGIPKTPGGVDPITIHSARIIMSLPAARELRDILVKNVQDAPDEEPENRTVKA